MGAGRFWNVEWLTQNSQRKYPISEVATCVDTSASFTIPTDLIVDMVWPVHAFTTLQPGRFHIKNISIFAQGVTITLGYDGDAIASVSVAISGFTRNSVYTLQGIDDFADSRGTIVIGSLTNALAFPGSWDFDITGGRIEPSAVRPDIQGVSSFIVVNGTEESEEIQGDVSLESGTNMRLDYYPATATTNARIVFNAISGEGLGAECECIGGDADAPCIRRINGVAPDSNEDFNFDAGANGCIEINGKENGVEMADTCSDPCCGCKELEVLTQTLQRMQNQVTSLFNLAERLETNMFALETNLLASKLNFLCESSSCVGP